MAKISLFDYLNNLSEPSQDNDSVLHDDYPVPGNDIVVNTPATSKLKPLNVGDLTLLIKGKLEATFNDIWVVGEISNLSRPRSGHCYLTLKDEIAQLPSVIWRSAITKIKFDLSDGLLVTCRGRIDVYPPHGKYQLVIDQLEPVGQGGLELAFRQLHAKLSAEGLFDIEKKKRLPGHLRQIAVVTSETGAAVRDFLQVLARRTNRTDVLIVPVRVQGDGASREIANAIQLLNHAQQQCTTQIDCIVVTRGGGSIEDLWAFNEEMLVRAVAASNIPVVSAVGHEIDVTLCDLAADIRALTPSEAAERLSDDDSKIVESLNTWQVSMKRNIIHKIEFYQQQLLRFAEHPLFKSPMEAMIFPRQKTIDHLDDQLQHAITNQIKCCRTQFGHYVARIEALSPLAVLGRGYSLTFDVQKQLLKSINTVTPGDTITTQLGDGRVQSVVQSTTKNENHLSVPDQHEICESSEIEKPVLHTAGYAATHK